MTSSASLKSLPSLKTLTKPDLQLALLLGVFVEGEALSVRGGVRALVGVVVDVARLVLLGHVAEIDASYILMAYIVMACIYGPIVIYAL